METRIACFVFPFPLSLSLSLSLCVCVCVCSMGSCLTKKAASVRSRTPPPTAGSYPSPSKGVMMFSLSLSLFVSLSFPVFHACSHTVLPSSSSSLSAAFELPPATDYGSHSACASWRNDIILHTPRTYVEAFSNGSQPPSPPAAALPLPQVRPLPHSPPCLPPLLLTVLCAQCLFDLSLSAPLPSSHGHTCVRSLPVSRTPTVL